MLVSDRRPFLVGSTTHHFSDSARHVLVPFLFSRCLLVALALLLGFLLRDQPVLDHPYPFRGDVFMGPLSDSWDSPWYESIAKSGYSTSPDVSRMQNYAFFPLYPLLMRVVGDVTGLGGLNGGYAIAGFLLSNVSFFFALVLLYELTREVWGDSALASRAVWLLAAWPWSYIFSMTYTESLFLALSLAALLAAYKLREGPHLPGVLLFEKDVVHQQVSC